MNNTFVAIIPARGGSKRLPRKNVLELSGKPLIVYSIEAGLKSKYINKVLVSSDDQEILDISNKHGSDILKRPSFLASDFSTTYDAVKHAIDNLERYDYLVVLQPTSPLRTMKHINEAIELLYLKKADAVISVCEMEHSPLWSNTLNEHLDMTNFINEDIMNKRSQDLDKYFRLNGAIYICKVDRFLKEKSLFINNNIYAYIMKKSESIDIDEEIDFKIAEFLI